jgi:hypothetical protein
MSRLIKTIDKHIYSYGADNLFYDFIDYCLHAGSMTMLPKPNVTADKEAILHSLLVDLQETEPYDDPFGAAYEYVAGKSKKQGLGQFFTPMHITDMMTELIIGEVEDSPIRCQEPSVGSGRAILSFMRYFRKQVKDKGLTNASCVWWAIDLDPLCVKMATMNCLLNDIDAVIFNGDTLSLEMRCAYTIERERFTGFPFIVKHEHDSKSFELLLKRLVGPVQVHKLPEAPREEQATLFNLDAEEYVEKKEKARTVKVGKQVDNQLNLFDL